MGILDPPGFDNVSRRNSFEQLISNITNEQLNYHYNQNIFSWEMVCQTHELFQHSGLPFFEKILLKIQQDYKDEGIRMSNFDFKDNRNTLNAMLSKPDGLLAVIDEQSRLPDADMDSLLGQSLVSWPLS